MNVNYRTDETHAYQTIDVSIHSHKSHVFKLLGTTEGIKQWFPELSFEEERAGSQLIFDLGNNEYEYAKITDYHPNDHIDVLLVITLIKDSKTVYQTSLSLH